MSSSSYSSCEYLAYAQYSIAAKSNEDRYSAVMDHTKRGVKSMASFGVYDGHMGTYCADVCATQLQDMVALTYCHLTNASRLKTVDSSDRSSDEDNGPGHLLRSPSKSPRTDCGYSISDEESGCVWRDSKVYKAAEEVSSSTTLNDSCLRDAIICESIRRSHETLDKKVTDTTNSGSTISSLYLEWEDDANSSVVAGKQSRPVNVYCANVGDSRCVMLRSYNTASALMLPTSYKCQSKSTQQRTGAQPVKLLPFPDTNHHPRSEIKKSLSAGSDLKLGVPAQCIPLSPLLESQKKQPTQILKNFTAVHLMSEDHTLLLSRERERIENRAKVRWHALPADASAIYLPAFVRTRPPLPTSTQSLIIGNQTNATAVESADPAHVSSDTLLKKAPTSLTATASIPSLSSLKVGSSPKLRAKEFLRARISHPELRLTTHGGPVGVDLNAWNGKKAPLLESVSDHGLGISEKSSYIFDWAYPSPEDETAASNFIYSIVKNAGNVPHLDSLSEVKREVREIINSAAIDNPNALKKEMNLMECMKDDNYIPKLVSSESFIHSRTSKEGHASGPEALFGRYNISILMTRSIGDRYGPRSCISLPEISSYTVPTNTHARFIIASDGFWDVVSLESVRCSGLTASHRDPRVLASMLAEKALRRRTKAKMRSDDITVIVVDVNPSSFVAVDGKGGSDCSSNGGEKCIVS